MNWQGVPFPIDPSITSYGLSISKLPIIAVQTSSGIAWDTIAASVIGAVIASSIPAAIAWWSIRKNVETLENDREKQQSSFDKDRSAQLDIATKNLNAQVLSTNRQQWINSLRESIADYLGAVHALRRSRTIARWSWDSAEKNGQSFHIDYLDVAVKMMDDSKEVDRLAYKIKLLVNPKEKEAIEIIRILDEVPNHTGDFNSKPDKQKLNELSDKLVILSQSYLKGEWDRVKLMQ